MASHVALWSATLFMSLYLLPPFGERMNHMEREREGEGEREREREREGGRERRRERERVLEVQ